jgi:hypothetical protein
MRSVWRGYDALATDGDIGSAYTVLVLTLISTLKRLMSLPARRLCAGCTVSVYLQATLNHTFMATTSWTTSRRWWRWLPVR